MKKAATQPTQRYMVPTERETDAERVLRVAAYLERTRAAFASTLTLPGACGVLAGPRRKRKVAA